MKPNFEEMSQNCYLLSINCETKRVGRLPHAGEPTCTPGIFTAAFLFSWKSLLYSLVLCQMSASQTATALLLCYKDKLVAGP